MKKKKKKKPQQNLMVSAINYEPWGVPLEVSGRMNAQTLRFHQLKVRGDLSNYRALPGQYSFVFTQWLGSAFFMYDHESQVYTIKVLPVLTTTA